ncbi:MAG: hypothetical protein V7L00_16460 [Nostoc sp.]
MDTDEELSDSWWKRVRYYAQLMIERVESLSCAVSINLGTSAIGIK